MLHGRRFATRGNTENAAGREDGIEITNGKKSAGALEVQDVPKDESKGNDVHDVNDGQDTCLGLGEGTHAVYTVANFQARDESMPPAGGDGWMVVGGQDALRPNRFARGTTAASFQHSLRAAGSGEMCAGS